MFFALVTPLRDDQEKQASELIDTQMDGSVLRGVSVKLCESVSVLAAAVGWKNSVEIYSCVQAGGEERRGSMKGEKE